jgi:hypothetical protein
MVDADWNLVGILFFIMDKKRWNEKTKTVMQREILYIIYVSSILKQTLE